ncbi:MAG: helicase, partial [Devosia sp.]
EEFVLSTDGTLRWRGEVVASLAEGDNIYLPRLILLADESLSGPDLDRVQDRLNLWLRHHVNTVLAPVLALEAPTDIEGAARGVAYRLYENLGLLPRGAVSEEVKGLDQDVRAKLRKLGVKFGAYHIYVPLALKPGPRELALILFALKNGGVRQPGVSELPHTVLSGRTSFQVDPEISTRLYEVAGFKVAGKRAVRIDILERLADIIRPLIALDPKTHQGTVPAGAAEANGFRVTVEMTSLLGTAGEDFASILTSLGYRVRRTPKVAQPVEVAATEVNAVTADVADAVVNEAAVEAVEGAEPALAPEAQADAAAEQAHVETATADLGAPPPEAGTSTAEATATIDVAAAVEEFDEVWFPGGRRPDNQHQKPNGKRPFNRGQRDGAAVAPAVPAADGAATVAAEGEKPVRRFDKRERNDGDGKPARSRFDNAKRNGSGPRDGGKPFEGKPKFGGKRNDREREDWRQHQPREKRDVPLDPNSPWAALAALRNPKQE